MSENTTIEWADHTFNPWEGCTKISPGCDHCYAETRNARFGGGTAPNWGAGAPRRRTSAANWRRPISWNAAHDSFHAQHGRRQRVFCASLADVFDNEVDPQWRADLFRLIATTPNLDWLLLTKRIGNVEGMVPLPWISQPFQHGPDPTNIYPAGWPENVWLGATVVNQIEADRDIPKLLALPAAKRFLSIEPLLGAIDLAPAFFPCINAANGIAFDPTTGASECCRRCDYTGIGDEIGIDWVIVGGESGPDARPMHPDWAYSLQDQCVKARVPFFFKQWGEYANVGSAGLSGRAKVEYIKSDGSFWDFPPSNEDADATSVVRVGKRAAGRLLGNRTWDQFPEQVK